METDWKTLLPACFGAVDCKFALHPYDRQNARELLVAAGRAGVTWKELEQAARQFLTDRQVSEAHLEEQIALMRDARSYLD